MAYRFTNTEKWEDGWFSGLRPNEKLLFIYLCDNCDIAGFIEINLKRWSIDISINLRGIEGALKGLEKSFIKSKSNDCLYIKNFLKHQKNYPLNSKNKSHQGIFKRFELYSYKFEIQDINKFIEGGSKGLPSPTGNGNGNGNGNEGVQGENKIDYSGLIEIYHSLCPKMNRVEVINKQRKGFIDARIAEYGLSKVTETIRIAGESDFLNGKNDKAWKADFEWILRPSNFIKIMEGKYTKNAATDTRRYTYQEILEINKQSPNAFRDFKSVKDDISGKAYWIKK